MKKPKLQNKELKCTAARLRMGLSFLVLDVIGELERRPKSKFLRKMEKCLDRLAWEADEVHSGRAS